MKGEAHNSATVLVTDNERTAQLHKLLRSRFTNHGHLLMPTVRQYEMLDNDEGLLAVTKDFCRWLGYKPHHLIVTFSRLDQLTRVSENRIEVDEQFRDHPLTTGGLLALATLDYVFQHHHYQTDARFLEVSSIETGLGLWMMNALKPVRSRRETVYHMLDGAWLQLEGIGLQAMSAAEYMRRFTIFTSQHRLFPEDYTSGLSRRHYYLLPQTPGTDQRRFLPEPTAIRNHIQKANALWLKLALIALTIGTMSACCIFLWTQRYQPIPTEQINAEKSLQTVKDSLNDCVNKASEQQSTYDPNDIFMTRQVDATKSRCESLRNQYNDQLDHYQKDYLRN